MLSGLLLSFLALDLFLHNLISITKISTTATLGQPTHFSMSALSLDYRSTYLVTNFNCQTTSLKCVINSVKNWASDPFFQTSAVSYMMNGNQEIEFTLKSVISSKNSLLYLVLHQIMLFSLKKSFEIYFFRSLLLALDCNVMPSLAGL